LRFIFQRRYLFHLLFWLMYFVFAILEIQGTVMRKGWLFCVPPMLIHFALMAMLVYGNTLILIPLLLEKRKVMLYVSGIIVLLAANTLLRSMASRYWDSLVYPEERMTIQSYFKWNLFFALWFALISTMLYFTQKWT